MRTNSPRRRSNDFVSHVTDITLIRYYWSNREEKERERKMCNLMENCRVRFMMQGVERNRCSP